MYFKIIEVFFLQYYLIQQRRKGRTGLGGGMKGCKGCGWAPFFPLLISVVFIFWGNCRSGGVWGLGEIRNGREERRRDVGRMSGVGREG